MGERRRLLTGDENDVHTGWRRVYVWTQRAGATAKVKRRTRRRERREGKQDTARREQETDRG
ncbi:MAG: hypothetical protein ACRDXE_09045 [Acidimicrobiales bacterium]